MRFVILAIFLASLCGAACADNDCWTLSDLEGVMAHSKGNYEFAEDEFTHAMILCFNRDTQTGTVSGDDTPFAMFGNSTLVGWVQNGDLELFEVFQIDRIGGKVLFTKSRIGTASFIPNMADVIGAYTGKAVKLK